ncbi:histidine phosphatase family protein [Oscillochloris sp. ZM17-4]|uniref:histidine phosphatase family protein n=1 Tax=Oscillochloris sp. ZM17-4 TaxID=2866714 RepID=UPI001C72CA0D|nr:histidine phosphatase family protein [Oscillochloris sp. ZM17-4]MBX0326343.1 histidine phosphatase family protein [Oscillochloris sp. ZM17-4]
MLSDIYLIRHGTPAQNPAIPYNTPPGPDLSERGRAEARQAAAFLADKGVEQLFVSPFARTTQTAEVIIDVLGLPATFTTLLQEHGPGETFDTVRGRVRDLLSAAADSPQQRVAFVSHGSPIRAALLELSKEKIDLTKHNYPGGNAAPTCGIWHVQRLDAQQLRFELIFKPTP